MNGRRCDATGGQFLAREAADSLPGPFVVVDKRRLLTNIQRMADLARAAGVLLRPHVKTHKTREIAQLQLAAGAIGLTCATLPEAERMAEVGCRDILIAHQLAGPAKLARAMVLAERVRLGLGVDDAEQARAIAKAAEQRGVRVDLWIELDSGLARAGLPAGERVTRLAHEIAALPCVGLAGLFTHAGHAYRARPEDLPELGRSEAALVVGEARRLSGPSHRLRASAGSTPTARHALQVPGLDELRPGNYVFNDAIQIALGVADEGGCALRVGARVVSRPAPERLILDAGAKVLGLDAGAHGARTVTGHGLVVGHPDWTIERLSEEHAVCRVSAADPAGPGTYVEIIPNHACAVVNLSDGLWIAEDGDLVGRWEVIARGWN